MSSDSSSTRSQFTMDDLRSGQWYLPGGEEPSVWPPLHLEFG